MKALTQEQADALREHRPKVRQLIQLLDQLTDVVADLCDCEENRDCYLCRLFRPLGKADMLIDPSAAKQGLAAMWDDALEHGPMPKEPT